MSSEETLRPGQRERDDVADSLLKKLRSKLCRFLNHNMAANVPLACKIVGKKFPELFVNHMLNSQMGVWLYFENSNEVRSSTIGDFEEYLSKKKPWEDYDICVFDESFSWFVGVTHNDSVIAVGIEDLLGK